MAIIRYYMDSKDERIYFVPAQGDNGGIPSDYTDIPMPKGTIMDYAYEIGYASDGDTNRPIGFVDENPAKIQFDMNNLDRVTPIPAGVNLIDCIMSGTSSSASTMVLDGGTSTIKQSNIMIVKSLLTNKIIYQGLQTVTSSKTIKKDDSSFEAKFTDITVNCMRYVDFDNVKFKIEEYNTANLSLLTLTEITYYNSLIVQLAGVGGENEQYVYGSVNAPQGSSFFTYTSIPTDYKNYQETPFRGKIVKLDALFRAMQTATGIIFNFFTVSDLDYVMPRHPYHAYQFYTPHDYLYNDSVVGGFVRFGTSSDTGNIIGINTTDVYLKYSLLFDDSGYEGDDLASRYGNVFDLFSEACISALVRAKPLYNELIGNNGIIVSYLEDELTEGGILEPNITDLGKSEVQTEIIIDGDLLANSVDYITPSNGLEQNAEETTRAIAVNESITTFETKTLFHNLITGFEPDKKYVNTTASSKTYVTHSNENGLNAYGMCILTGTTPLNDLLPYSSELYMGLGLSNFLGYKKNIADPYITNNNPVSDWGFMLSHGIDGMREIRDEWNAVRSMPTLMSTIALERFGTNQQTQFELKTKSQIPAEKLGAEVILPDLSTLMPNTKSNWMLNKLNNTYKIVKIVKEGKDKNTVITVYGDPSV